MRIIQHTGHCGDGVDQCIKATREQLRGGAHCIKIMGSGGVSSPTDPIWMNQFREDEIRAIVNETEERRTYTSRIAIQRVRFAAVSISACA